MNRLKFGLKSRARGDANAQRPKIDWRWLGWTTVKAVGLAIWTGLVIMAVQLATGYLLLWILGRETFMSTATQAIWSATFYVLAFLILWLVTPKIGRNTRRLRREELGLKGTPTWTDIGLAPIGLIVSLVAAWLLSTLFSVFPWFDANQAQELGFGDFLVGADRLIAMIAIVLMAPIAEELIFRGWLYGKLRAMFATRTARSLAVIIPVLTVSLLFGVLHGQWNVGITVFAMSVVMCLMREITGTIYAGMLLHILKNAVAFYMMYVLLGAGM